MLEVAGLVVLVTVDQTWEEVVTIMIEIEAESVIETEIAEEVVVMIVEGMLINVLFLYSKQISLSS
jgi:hypothetical protein